MHKNRYLRTIFITLLVLSFTMLISCDKEQATTTALQNYNQGIENIINQDLYISKVANPATDNEEDLVDSSANDFKDENTATVMLNDDQTVINNSVADTSIYMEDGNLIVNSTKKMTLVVSGTLNGSIIVYKTDGKFKLVLDNVDITATSGPAINLQTEKRVFLVLNDNSVNYITDAADHPLMSNGSKTNAAIFSEEQMVISGNGELNVTSQYKHGINSDDYLKIRSGVININSASDGLHANDYIVIDDGEINIDSGSDGMECEKGYIVINGGMISITSANNGIKTSYDGLDTTIMSHIQINHGYIEISAQANGIKSVSDIDLNLCALNVDAADDSIKSDGMITVTDGIFYIHSLDKQSLDGDLGINILGGTAVMLSDGTADSLKSDNGEITINGGTLVIAGPNDILISDSEQGYVKCGTVSANEVLNVRNEQSLITVAFLEQYNHVIISTSDMIPGDTLSLYSGGQIDGDNFYGLFLNGSYLEGTQEDIVLVQ